MDDSGESYIESRVFEDYVKEIGVLAATPSNPRRDRQVANSKSPFPEAKTQRVEMRRPSETIGSTYKTPNL